MDAADTSPSAPTRYERSEGACGSEQCVSLVVEPLFVRNVSEKAGSLILKAVNDVLLKKTSGAEAAATVEEFGDAVLHDYKEARQASGLEEVWQIVRSAQLLFQNSSVITVAVNRSELTGGAHPVESTTFLSFEARTGKSIDVKQLLQPGKAQLLQKLMTFELKKERTVPAGQSLRDAGFSVDDESSALVDMASIGIIDNALRVHYDPYQIAPYASGPIDFTLSPETSMSVFRHDSPYLAHLFGGEPNLK